MIRSRKFALRLVTGLVVFAVGAIALKAGLHHEGIDYKLTTVSFSFGREAQAQAPMAEMDMPKPPAAPSTSLVVTVDGKATTFSVADLKAMPQTTVKVHNEHSKMDESYSGVPVGDLLAKCGFKAEPATHHKLLRSYVTAEGTDKYWVLYSATEVEASEHVGEVIVATSMNGGTLGADGELKLINTEDKKPERWVRNLAAISMKSAE